jgi:hypothetical protein
LVVCAVLFGVGGSARACMNDEESRSGEQEFRSQYERFTAAPSFWDEFDHHRRFRQDLMFGSGAALLGGAFVLAARRGQSKGPGDELDSAL